MGCEGPFAPPIRHTAQQWSGLNRGTEFPISPHGETGAGGQSETAVPRGRCSPGRGREGWRLPGRSLCSPANLLSD